MNINRISIGLLFLILALVVMPGASALPAYKPASNGLHMAAAAPGCAGGCHNMPVFCAGCHAYPYATPTPGPVPAQALATIAVSPATVTIVGGSTQTFTAEPKDQNGNPIVVAITWASSNTTVGNVDESGKFTASTEGITTITAANGTVNGTATVTVTSTSTSTKYYTVTFIVTDNVTGKPIHDAKVSIGGIKKETNRSGIVVFKKVSQGSHTYKIKAEHYTKFKGLIEVGANMSLSVKLTPNKEKDHENHEEKDHEEHHDKEKESDQKDKNITTEKKQAVKETD